MPLVRAGLLQTEVRPTSAALRYGLALLFVAAALALNVLPGVRALPFLFSFGAVALSARYCGPGPAMLATFLSALLADYVLFQPSFAWTFRPADLFRLLCFVLVSFVIISVARKRSEAELNVEEARRRLVEILQSVSEGVVVLDRTWTITYLNEPGARIVGLSIGNVLGKKIWRFFPRATGTALQEQFERALNEHKVVRFERYYEPRSAWYQINVYPGEQGLTVFFQEITEKKRAEEALRKSEKLAAAGRLAATIAHEINNPLEGVTNLLFLLRKNDSLDEKARKHLAMAEQELARVAHVARQTLGFYRDTTAPKPLNIASTLDEVLGLYGRRIEAKKLQVRKEYGPDPVVTALAGEVRQVLSNLLVNAIDATADRGRLRLRARFAHDWTCGKPGVRVTVADTGVGIAPENRTNLFQPFHTTKKDVGTGLGLWVSREIIQKHAGKIRVRSSVIPGRSGTVFTVFLPLGAAQPVSSVSGVSA